MARRMIQMTMALNEKNFEGKPEVSCYSCHRGHPKPVSIPLIPESPEPSVQSREPQKPAADLPQPEDILRRYYQALGGAERIATLTSISTKGDIEAGRGKFPLEILKAKPDRISTLVHYPQGDMISNFDGNLGWVLSPDRPVRAMNPSELDFNRIDGGIPFASDLKTLFHDLQTVRREKVGDQDSFVLRANRPNMPPVELYFDVSSGLLIRLVRYAKSPLGLLPTRTDFSDYREIDGFKMPFHWNSATPTGRFAVQIASTTLNSPINNSAFTKPASAVSGSGGN